MLILPKPVKGGKDDAEQKEFDEAYSEVEKKIKGAEA
jgi:H/ACA ribonucleoprotein complex subunit 2